jgi:hypothetical protein
VHRAAAGDQQAPAGPAAIEQREAEQPGDSRGRDRDATAAGERGRPEPPEAPRGVAKSLAHGHINPTGRRRAPQAVTAPTCNRSFRQEVRRAPRRRLRKDGHLAGGPNRRRGDRKEDVEKATRRGNYESGSDYVLEYGELRFSFNEQDFAQRVEQAAVKLDFVDQGLEAEEIQDLLDLAVNGEILEPSSALIVEHWTELVGPANRSLVHWIRRLVFRGAWLDQRVKEGELDVVFEPDTHTFGYVQPERDSEPIELSREPSWARLAYRS